MQEKDSESCLHPQLGEVKVEIISIAVGNDCNNKKVSDLSTLDGNVLYCHGCNG